MSIFYNPLTKRGVDFSAVCSSVEIYLQDNLETIKRKAIEKALEEAKKEMTQYLLKASLSVSETFSDLDPFNKGININLNIIEE